MKSLIYFFGNIQFALSDVVISGIVDSFPKLRRYKSYVIIGYCIVCFLLALPMCAPVSDIEIKDNEMYIAFVHRVESIYSYVEFSSFQQYECV